MSFTKEKFIEVMREKLDELEKNEVGLSNTILETIRRAEISFIHNAPLVDYGITQMDESIEYIKNKDFSSISEFVDYVLEDSFKDGSLTYDSYKAEKELLANYDLEEIFEKSQEYNTKEPETLHLIAVQEELVSALEEKQEKISSSINMDVEDKDLVLLSAYTLLNENGFNYNEQIKELKKEIGLENEEKTTKIKIPKKEKNVDKGNER